MSDAPTRPIATPAGLRGRPGRELSDDLIASTVERFGVALRERGVATSLVLARDGRPGGRRLADLVGQVARAGAST
jgi:phosphomannomutase